MRANSLTSAAAALLSCIVLAAPGPVAAQGGPALAGTVSSAEEGRMEGVIVSAKRAGGSITTSVISDKDGRYAFPAGRLAPGHYDVAIRAAGYDLGGPKSFDLASGPASLDLALVRTRNLPGQLTNAEWLASIPGPVERKAALLSCTGCHTTERIFRSTHDADEFTQVMTRMEGYASVSFWLQPQLRVERRGAPNPEQFRRQAEFLAGVNLSKGPSWDYELKSFPRIGGRGTRAIITEYDLPKRTGQPHDVVVASDGMVWYTDFGQEVLGKLDPATGKIREYPIPSVKKGAPTGSLDLEMDKDGNFWIGMMYQGAVGKFDRKTEQFQIWPMPPEFNDDKAQLNMVTIRADLDGKVWTNNNDGSGDVFRLDLASGKYEKFKPLLALTGGVKAHHIYDVLADSRNNVWMTDISENYVGRIDAKTAEVKFWQVPTEKARNRRGRMDDQDRLFFAEFGAGKLAMFDTRSEAVKEWKLPTPWSAPYDVVWDKNGELWAAGMSTDRVARVEPNSGAVVEYPLPRDTNTRRVFVDNRTSPVTFWTGSNHSGVILKLEPLD
jgi:virginiamycin B lyase